MLAAPDLRLGRLLAEGGEGRVFELDGPDELFGLVPGLVAATGFNGPDGLSGAGDQRARPLLFKQLRRSLPMSEVEPLVAYLALLGQARPGHAARVASASAFPLAAVTGTDKARAVGTVMARAPGPFWLSHRDGPARLATLSYLASDPERIEVAYGLAMPAPGAAERVAVVYALARLLEAWQGRGPADGLPVPALAHGDLSAKNVLWSVSPVPAVYVLDCDGARLLPAAEAGPGEGDGCPAGEARADRGGQPDGEGRAEGGRPRAVTPNWDDPALANGHLPGLAADRYVLGLCFLRVLGAAHFPLQGRQKTSAEVDIDLELPRSWRKLPDMPALWALCERALSVAGADRRPSPAEWVAQLEELLDVLGASWLAAAVRQAQGDPRPGPSVAAGGAGAPVAVPARAPDVVVRPVLRTRATSTWQLISPRPAEGPAGEMVMSNIGPAASMSARQAARRGMALWAAAHRLALRMVRSPGRRATGLRRLVSMVVLDFAAAGLGLFMVAMAVSPWIGL